MHLSRLVPIGLLFFTVLANPLVADTASAATAGRSHYRLLLVGDTSFGEQYQARYARKGGQNILRSKGYDHSLEKLAPLMQSADLVVANIHHAVIERLLDSGVFRDAERFIISGLMRSQYRDVKSRLEMNRFRLLREWDHDMTWFTCLAEKNSGD
jgi:hypothetical protein